MTEDEKRQLLTPAEAAKILRVSESTIRRWLEDDEGPIKGIKIARLWRIPVQEIERILSGGKRS